MDLSFLYYPLSKDDANFIYQYYPSYENNLNSNDEDSDDEVLKLKVDIEFKICEEAESYLENYAKTEKAVLVEDRRERRSEMIGCTWQVNMSFPKKALKVQITSVVGVYCHTINSLIMKIASKFHCLTNEMLEKLSISMQYNLLTASFSDKKVNKKDLSNAIEHYKKQLKPQKIDDPLWIVKSNFDLDERRLTELFWISSDQTQTYEQFEDVVIIDTISQTNQFDMILLIVTVIDNNFRSLVMIAAFLKDETEVTFSWVLNELREASSVTPTIIYSDTDSALISAVQNNH
ncbi:17316_t:CDS:2 [Racocetra fulgida]|uniref:17316_t:CDS:1 n=1 Tax=Racocetra fulgida TaxID=60492 RepID=A0A9N9DEB4_9GLOM|nr:17316_t:CDS:2 [Racocetra fulgida]